VRFYSIDARPRVQGASTPLRLTERAGELTDGAGLLLVRALWDRLQLGKRIDHRTRAIDRRYRSSLLIESWIALLFYGGGSMADLDAMARRGVARLFGWRAVPDETTCGRWLRRGGRQMVTLLDELVWYLVRARWAEQGVPGRLMLILDSTVVTRYGAKQAGAVKGYNPVKKGRPSHHPLLAFTDGGDCLGVQWRDGGAHTADGAIAWIRTLVARLRQVGVVDITVRLDKGFFSKEIVDALHGLDVHFVLKVPDHVWVRRKLMAYRQSKKEPRLWTATGRLYDARLCSIERRRTVKTALGVTTWERDDRPVAHVLTNIPKLSAVQAWRRYNAGTVVEQRIKELYQLSFGKTAIDDRTGNAILSGLGVVAYQLLHVVRTTSLSGDHRWAAPSTLRTWVFRMPAKLVAHARAHYVHLRWSEPFAKELRRALRSLSALAVPRTRVLAVP
jgi:hypothetical protein